MRISKFLLPTTALLFALIVLVGGSNIALAIRNGNGLVIGIRNYNGEQVFNPNGLGGGQQGIDPGFDYDNITPEQYELNWHTRDVWYVDPSYSETAPGTDREVSCDEALQGELATCGFAVTIPGLPTNYNPDYGNLALDPQLQPNPDFPTTPINPNDPFDPLASDVFNNANALGPNPGRMLRTKTEKGSFATFALDDPSIIQRGAVWGRPVPLAELDTTQPVVFVINHDVNLPVDVNSPTDNGGRADGIRIGDYAESGAIAQLDLRAGDVFMEGRFFIGSSQSNSRATFNMTGGSVTIGTAAESTQNIQGGPLDNFRDAKMFIGRSANSPDIFNHEAGDVSISGALLMTNSFSAAGAVGTYNMSPGANLTLHRLGGDETAHIYLSDGAEALATINQNGGTVTVDAGVHLGRHGGIISPVIPALNLDPGLGIYNLVGGASSAAGDFDGDGDVDGADFLLWQRGGSPNGAGSGDLATWTADYGTAGGGGGVTTLIQGTSTTFDGVTGDSQKDAIIVGNAGFGQLNIDSSAGDVVLDGNAILVAALDTTQGPTPSGTAPSTGLVNIIGENATITIGDLSVGAGAATFRFEADAGVSAINVEAGHGDPLNLGDVDISGATLDVDLSNLDAGAGDLLLIGVGGTLTGEFAGLAQNAAVTAGYTISYTFGDGNDIGLVAPGGLAAVPEPASIMLCLFAAAAVGCCRQQCCR